MPELYELQQARLLESFGAFNPATAAMQTDDRAERVPIARVTSGFFAVLGIRPQLGRAFGGEEDLEGNDLVALVSAEAFHRMFGGDPASVGRSVTLDGRSRRIVGVLPEGFAYGGAHDFFIPYGFTQAQRLSEFGFHYLEVLAKLRPGVSRETARKELEQLSMRMSEAHPQNYPPEMRSMLQLQPLRDRFVASSREPILVLFGAVLLVLLIACANVANLLLARAAAREREFLRAALGAERMRIVRQLLTEGLLLSALGAVLGILLAAWGLDALVAAAPRQIGQLGQVGVDGAVLGFSAGLTIATTMVFALVPALRATRVDLAASLKDAGRGTADVPSARLRAALVVVQVAVSLFLLAGAGLLLRSYEQLLRVSPGFDPDGAVTAELRPAGPAYADAAARERYFEDALRTAATLPGVMAAGGISVLPTRGKYGQTYDAIEGYEPPAGAPMPTDEFRCVLPGYFAAMRQHLVAGRDFSAADDARAPAVVLVNEAWARRYFPGRDVIGRRIQIDTDRWPRAWRTIVGVVSDARDYGLDEPVPPIFYFAAAQEPPDRMTLIVRGRIRPGELREPLARIDPSQPVDRVSPLRDVLAESLAARRFPLRLLGVFAALALVLSAVGIYGVTAYAVAQRTREIGVRMAIGASAGEVVRMVLASALRTVGLGLCIGTAGALVAGRLIASQLYGVNARDPLTFAAIAGLLGAVALAASGIPAMRAARIDPIAALRAE